MEQSQEKNIGIESFSLHQQLPTLTEIKSKLPGHCFRSNVQKSTFYAILDIFLIVFFYTVAIQLKYQLEYGFLLYPLYWFAQGEF
jgi:hypothetical protein